MRSLKVARCEAYSDSSFGKDVNTDGMAADGANNGATVLKLTANVSL